MSRYVFDRHFADNRRAVVARLEFLLAHVGEVLWAPGIHERGRRTLDVVFPDVALRIEYDAAALIAPGHVHVLATAEPSLLGFDRRLRRRRRFGRGIFASGERDQRQGGSECVARHELLSL